MLLAGKLIKIESGKVHFEHKGYEFTRNEGEIQDIIKNGDEEMVTFNVDSEYINDLNEFIKILPLIRKTNS